VLPELKTTEQLEKVQVVADVKRNEDAAKVTV
jgi:hypothetical protein